ncbi:MAG: succinate dehydrogenase cytochrome b subunit, partial [Verrucomicrobiae bacterium]|nr:succinate dehydrogenase cytochrome b subunit [Verrucomicrobiae bacterium]
MKLVVAVFQSSLGKKYVMAVTGLVLVLFVIGHMLGNLQVFLGREKLNQYAAVLKASPGLLWGVRGVLLVAVGLHLLSAALLLRQNSDARIVENERREPVDSTLASRTMIASGIILFTFIVFHLLHYTAHQIDPSCAEMRDAAGRHDVYGMVVRGFSNPVVSGFYIFSMALLCMHISHGASAMFQSLGLRTET